MGRKMGAIDGRVKSFRASVSQSILTCLFFRMMQAGWNAWSAVQWVARIQIDRVALACERHSPVYIEFHCQRF